MRPFTNMLVALALVGTSCATDDEVPDPTTDELSSELGEAFETRFLQAMIDHHHLLAETAARCDDAFHPRLAYVCGLTARTQAAEVARMQRWLLDWYGIEYAPVLTDQQQSRLAVLDRLTGSKLEIIAMRDLIRQHAVAARRAGVCEERAVSAPLLAACSDMVGVHTAEIDRLIDWICEWYEIIIAPPPGL